MSRWWFTSAYVLCKHLSVQLDPHQSPLSADKTPTGHELCASLQLRLELLREAARVSSARSPCQATREPVGARPVRLRIQHSGVRAGW